MSMLFGCSKKPNGDIYTLEEAYEMGLLSREDLMSITYYQMGNRHLNETVIPEDFKPKPRDPEVLSDKLKEKIVNDYFYFYIKGQEDSRFRVDHILTDGYYGCYDNCYVVTMMDRYHIYPDSFYDFEVGGVNFMCGYSRQFIVWRKK